MSYVVAALAVVGAVAMLNLILTIALIRRLRLVPVATAQQEPVSAPGDPATFVGRPIPDFAAASVDGAPVAGSDLRTSGGLIGFFSVGCPPCHVQAPEFARLAGAEPIGRSSVIAVVSGEAGHGDLDETLATALRASATVVVEPGFDGAVTRAFDVIAFPTLLRVDETGTVVAAGAAAADLHVSVR